MVRERGGASAPGGGVLRLSTSNRGCGGKTWEMAWGWEGPGDEVVLRDPCTGSAAVAVEGRSALHAAGAWLEWEDGVSGRRFVVRPPAAVRSCGCGESFVG